MPTTIPMIRRTFDGPIEIYPISDLHIGSREFNEPAFRQLVREILAEENRYVVLVGDLIDNGIKSSVTNVYDAVMSPKEQREHAAELLFPLKGRILCAVSGNHEYRSRKETDTDPAELILSKLGLEELFRPDIAFLDINLGKRNDNNKRPPRYCVGVVHGSGGGMMLGAGLNKSEPFAIALGVDLLIVGHTHRPMTAPTIRLQPDAQKGLMVAREIRLLIATGWLDYGGYPTRKMLKPVVVRPNKAILADKSFDISVLS